MKKIGRGKLLCVRELVASVMVVAAEVDTETIRDLCRRPRDLRVTHCYYWDQIHMF